MVVFLQVMVQVLLIYLSGFSLQKALKLDIKQISTLAMYLLLPFLVFKTFYERKLDLNFGYILVITLVIMLALLGLGLIIAKILHYN